MGGDGAITHELSDRLAEDLMNERFEALVLYLGDSHPNLTTEWVSAMFRLRDKEISSDRELFTPDMYAFAAKQSNKMRQLDWLDGHDVNEMYDRFPRRLHMDARDMYYAHSGIHSMIHRRDRLAAAAEIFNYSLLSSSRPDSFLARQTANMYEELAFYDMLDGQSGQHLAAARQLNETVVEDVPSWSYPYRIHALMSLFDLEAIELLTNIKRPDVSANPYLGLKKVHIDFNTALIFYARQIEDYANRGDEEIALIKNDELSERVREQANSRWTMMTGALAEGLAMSVIQDHILDKGLHKKYWVRQAFLREDSMADRSLPTPDRSEALDVPNLSFDLQIYEHTSADGANVPIEVKKSARPSRSSLHPDIEVITFKDSSQARPFAQTARAFATSQIEKYTGELSYAQVEAHDTIYNRVDPARLFKQL